MREEREVRGSRNLQHPVLPHNNGKPGGGWRGRGRGRGGREGRGAGPLPALVLRALHQHHLLRAGGSPRGGGRGQGPAPSVHVPGGSAVLENVGIILF